MQGLTLLPAVSSTRGITSRRLDHHEKLQSDMRGRMSTSRKSALELERTRCLMSADEAT